MLLLLLAEAVLLFGGLVVAVYVRLGAIDAEDALITRHGFYKAALATGFLSRLVLSARPLRFRRDA